MAFLRGYSLHDETTINVVEKKHFERHSFHLPYWIRFETLLLIRCAIWWSFFEHFKRRMPPLLVLAFIPSFLLHSFHKRLSFECIFFLLHCCQLAVVSSHKLSGHSSQFMDHHVVITRETRCLCQWRLTKINKKMLFRIIYTWRINKMENFIKTQPWDWDRNIRNVFTVL